MNLEKLTDELAKASEAKATKELDRMIKLHEDEVEKYTNAIKYYLQQVGTVVGKPLDYALGNANMDALLRNKAAQEILLTLKKNLE